MERSDSVSSDHFQGVNPLNPKNDQHKISPYNNNNNNNNNFIYIALKSNNCPKRYLITK